MADFIVALGLVFVIEGLIFAASPASAKNAMAHVLETPDGPLFGEAIKAQITQRTEGQQRLLDDPDLRRPLEAAEASASAATGCGSRSPSPPPA